MSRSKSTAPSMVSCICFTTDTAHLKLFFSDAIGLSPLATKMRRLISQQQCYVQLLYNNCFDSTIIST